MYALWDNGTLLDKLSAKASEESWWEVTVDVDIKNKWIKCFPYNIGQFLGSSSWSYLTCKCSDDFRGNMDRRWRISRFSTYEIIWTVGGPFLFLFVNISFINLNNLALAKLLQLEECLCEAASESPWIYQIVVLIFPFWSFREKVVEFALS